MNNEKILVCISGWGSHCQILEPLIAQCPLLAERHRIDIPWQDFVGLPDATRPAALHRYLSRETDGRTQGDKQTDVVILAWSLGCLLGLELSPELHGQAQTGRQRLILLSGTAAMCPTEEIGDRNEGEEKRANLAPYQVVKPIVLRLMQRKLQQAQNTVLRDFALHCLRDRQNDPANFVANYLEQARSFSDTPLHTDTCQALTEGLEYLIRCDLRRRLRDCPLPHPTLLFSGRRDAIIPASQSESLARLLPNSRQEFADEGHNLLLPPASGLSRHISTFLSQ
ncbi:alpha/beta hydrolase [Candidatus Haliotispira prima]|uniref:Alpha/beta hydrolase n=1 Tax=Candidatus Haliotispira prima TaxID=3034016 RepID=A0ABY8MGN8_9SPIO|nr:alpha/beta hydrolase [Candidatus Haliotispira prima]